jgi:glycosyltransferase involved in cell wall biosynthesis
MVEILRCVRALGHDIHFHIIGGVDHTPYGKAVRRLCSRNSTWVSLEGWKAGEDKEKLLAGHRYAIHARRGEAFGIGVAEMAKAGCLTFVPDEGGPGEIVNAPMLCYDDTADAVHKIDAVLKSTNLQQRLHRRILAHGRTFSVESYQNGIRELVREMLERNGRPNVALGRANATEDVEGRQARAPGWGEVADRKAF